MVEGGFLRRLCFGTTIPLPTQTQWTTNTLSPPPPHCHPPPIPFEEFRAGPLLSLSLEWLEVGMRERVGE